MLVKEYEIRIYHFLSKMCKDPTNAEDLTQETFINAFRKLDTFRGDSKFSTWLFQIATNNCLMHKRKIGPFNTKSLDEGFETEDGKEFKFEIADWSSNPAENIDYLELKEILDKALEEIPEIYRAVFILKDIEDFSSPEISEMLHISLPNVKARVLRARAKLQELLKTKFKDKIPV